MAAAAATRTLSPSPLLAAATAPPPAEQSCDLRPAVVTMAPTTTATASGSASCGPSTDASSLRTSLPGWQATAIVSLYIGLVVASSILAAVSKGDGKGNGEYGYNPVSATLTSDALKLVISAVALYLQGGRPERLPSLADVAPYAFPSVVYLLDDNLVFAALYWLRPSEFALFANFRILTTAFFFRLLLRRRITSLQWSALTNLMFGLFTARLGSTSKNAMHSLNPGHFFLLAICVIGALGNVYCEKILKANFSDSIHMQNMQLYMFSVMFNGAAFVVYGNYSQRSMSIFHGWTVTVVILAIVNAFVGLSNSALFKFLDNLVKVQASATAMMLTVVVSALLFGAEPSLSFYIAVGIVAISMYVYNHPSSKAAPEPVGDNQGGSQLMLPRTSSNQVCSTQDASRMATPE